ncbi:MAG: amino acid ABC transporter permease [Henriciella sp.]|nr:amino acid ABC transporter permease [Henriciella sp.]
MSEFLHQLTLSQGALLSGVQVTIYISFLSIIIGTAIGLVIGLVLTYAPFLARLPFRIYVDAIRGTPVLVLILAAYYVPAVLGVSLDALSSGILALTGFCAAHMGEIFRGAFQSVEKGQTEAARAIGLTFPQTVRYVLLPQVIRSVLPTWVNTGAELVKGSTLLSAIGVGELVLRTQEIIGRNFMTMEFYLVAGLIFLLINLAIESFGKYLERRLTYA